MRRLALALVALCACTQRTDLLASNAASVCAASGASVALAPGVPCGAALASQLFAHGICSCGDLTLPGALVTHGSMMMPGPPMGPTAPRFGVASNGSIAISGNAQLLGGAIAAGHGGVQLAATAVVVGDLRSAGPVAATELLSVAGELFAVGDVGGRIDVDGDVHVPPTANVAPTVNARAILREPVAVAPECGCSGRALDAAAVAHMHAAANDNAAIALDPAALAHVADGATVDLPCGAYYVSSIGGASLALRAHGKTALFVDGDVTLLGAMQVSLDASAELDLVVGGNLTVSALTGEMPASTRVWVGGSDVKLTAGALSVLLYAPGATLATSGALEASGALYVGALAAAGDVDLRLAAAASTCK